MFFSLQIEYADSCSATLMCFLLTSKPNGVDSAPIIIKSLDDADSKSREQCKV